MWFSDSVVMVAVPHDVVSVGTFAVARWMVASVRLVYPCSLQAIWGADAPRDNGIEDSPRLPIGSVIEPGAFSGEV